MKRIKMFMYRWYDCVEYFKKFIMKLLRLISGFSKVVVYKFNI